MQIIVPSVVCLMLKFSTANSLTFLQKLQCRSSWARIWKVNSSPCSNISLYLYLNKCIMEINIYLTLVLNRGSHFLYWLRALEWKKKKHRGMYSSGSLEFNEQSHLFPLKGRVRQGGRWKPLFHFMCKTEQTSPIDMLMKHWFAGVTSLTTGLSTLDFQEKRFTIN